MRQTPSGAFLRACTKHTFEDTYLEEADAAPTPDEAHHITEIELMMKPGEACEVACEVRLHSRGCFRRVFASCAQGEACGRYQLHAKAWQLAVETGPLFAAGRA